MLHTDTWRAAGPTQPLEPHRPEPHTPDCGWDFCSQESHPRLHPYCPETEGVSLPPELPVTQKGDPVPAQITSEATSALLSWLWKEPSPASAGRGPDPHSQLPHVTGMGTLMCQLTSVLPYLPTLPIFSRRL